MKLPVILLGAALLGAAPASAPARSAQSAATDRSGVVIQAVHRSGAVPRCWNAFLRTAPDAPSVRFRLRIEVTAAGRFERVALLDPTPGPLLDCVRRQVQGLSVPAGAPVVVESTYSFGAGVPAPVPAP